MKKFLYILLAIIGILLLGSLLISSNYHNERSIMVKAPIAVVFDQANTLKNWEKWSPWVKMDPSIRMTYNEIPSGKGAMYKWDGENPNVGKGSMTITSSVPNQFIVYAMSFDGQGDATSAHKFEQIGDSVKVTWTFDSDLGYNPVAKYMTKIMSGMMQETFDNGLKDMKAIAESMPAGQ
jgi:uncharacterized protein YndB with AHSA1/START domain